MLCILTDFRLCKYQDTWCRAAQENGVRANGVSILTGATKSRFSRIRSSVIPNPSGTKFTVEVSSTQGKPHSKFEEDSFCHSRETSNQTFEKNLHFLLLFAHFVKLL